MSVYRPHIADLYPALLIDGWRVMDKFGPLSGPYASCFEANAAINNESNPLTRHISYQDED